MGVGSFVGKGKRCNCGAYDMEDREAQRIHTEQNFDSQRPLKVFLCSNRVRQGVSSTQVKGDTDKNVL